MNARTPEPRPLTRGGAEGNGERAAAELLARLPELGSDRLAQERIWREVVETLPAPRGRSRWLPIFLSASGAAAVALIWMFNFGWESPPARLELTAGSVLSAAPERGWKPAVAGVSLPEASRLRTDDRSQAVMSLARSAVLVEPHTDLALEAVRGRTFLRLTGGALVAEVEHRQPGETFVVQTTHYSVTIKGTVFAVREHAADDVAVSVSRGLVEIAGAGGVWQVPAGRSWSSRQPDREGADDIAASERALLERSAGSGPRTIIQVQGTGVEISEAGLDLGPSPVSWNAPVGQYHFVGKSAEGEAEADASSSTGTSSTVTLAVGGPAARYEPPLRDVPELQEAPQGLPDTKSPAGPAGGAVPSKVKPRLDVATKPVPEASFETPAPVATGAGRDVERPPTAIRQEPELLARLDKPIETERERPPAAAPAAPVATPGPAASPPVVIVPDAYARALSLVRGGQYRAAAQALDAVASSHGSNAELALYDLALLRQRHLGDRAGALAALDRYEKEYPHGALEQEVELSAIQIELRRSNLVGALTQIDRFLDGHSDSERAPEVHVLRGNVLRLRGDCKGALREYGRAQDHDDGLYYTAFCQQKLGDQEEAAETLQAYQRRFPSGLHAAEVRAALSSR